MVRIRLRRVGSKGKAFYKIIVADQRSPQKGKYLEEVGTYDPHTNPASVKLQESKISDWISKGAQPSESVYKIFNIAGFNNDGKIKPLILKKNKSKHFVISNYKVLKLFNYKPSGTKNIVKRYIENLDH